MIIRNKNMLNKIKDKNNGYSKLAVYKITATYKNKSK